MRQEGDPPKRVDFKDVLLARRYRAAKERGDVSPALQAEVDDRGRSRIELICSILEVRGGPKKVQK